MICGWVVKAAPRWVPTDARVTATFVAVPAVIAKFPLALTEAKLSSAASVAVTV